MADWPGTRVDDGGASPAAAQSWPGTRVEPQSDSTSYAEEREPFEAGPMATLRSWGRMARGAAKTVGGLGVGAAQIATGGKPLEEGQRLVNEPGGSMAEEIGRYLPYLVAAPESWLARAAMSSGIAALQPTETGSIGSHALDATLGGLTGAGLAGADRARRAVANAPNIPFHWPHIGWHWMPGVGWVGALAARGAAMAGQRAASKIAGSGAAQSATRAISRNAPAITGAAEETIREAPPDGESTEPRSR